MSRMVYYDSSGNEFYPEEFAKDIYVPRKTNADCVRAMSDEELARFIGTSCFCKLCSDYEPGGYCDGRCEEHMLSWLKEEARA